MQSGRLGGASPDGGTHLGEDGLVGGLALLGQKGDEKRRARAGQGQALFPEETGVGFGVEALHHQQGRAAHQGGNEQADAADVGEREGQGPHIVGPQFEVFPDMAGRGDDRVVAVHGPLGVGGGARGVVDPAHWEPAVVSQGRLERGQGAGVTLGELAVAHQHVAIIGGGHHGLGHGWVVESPPYRWNHQQPGPGLANHEAHLPLPVDRDDRVLDCPQSGQRRRQDERGTAVGELPRHPSVCRHTHRGQPGGYPLGGIPEAGEGHHCAVGLDG